MKIIKRDKSIEEFDIAKVTRVVQAAGLTEDQANEATKTIQQWISQQDPEQILSTKLRDVVCKQLEKFSKTAADMYNWYEENKYKK